MSTQALPLFVLLGSPWLLTSQRSLVSELAVGLNVFLLLMRWGMQVAIVSSYDRSQKLFSPALCFWLSPLADPLAVLRIFLSSLQTTIQWRGRTYHKRTPANSYEANGSTHSGVS